MTRPETAGAGAAEMIARGIVQVHRHVHGMGPQPDALVVLIAKAITAAESRAMERADALIVELEAVLAPFAKAADMLEVAGATTADEIELSGERLHSALKAARAALRSSQRRSSINPPGEEE